MIKISVCSYRYKHRYLIAICHNTKGNLVKAKLVSTEILNIKPSNIEVIKDNTEMAQSPDQIIQQCLHEAMSQGNDLNEISEVIYFGDVNLSKPGLCEYPLLLRDKHQFSTLIKTYFPQCISIKRILVSAEELIVSDAEKAFAEYIGHKDPDLPVVIDICLNKGHMDLYTPIHCIDFELINSIMNYFMTTKASISQDEGDLGFLRIKPCLSRLNENFDCLYGPEGYPLTFDFIYAQQEDFFELSVHYDHVVEQLFCLNKSMLLSLAFSHLIPSSSRALCLDRLNLERHVLCFSFFGELKHHHLGAIIDAFVTEQHLHLQQHRQVSVQMVDKIDGLLIGLYGFKSSESLLGQKTHQYAYLTPETQVIVNALIDDLECLLRLLAAHLVRMPEMDEHLANLKQKIDIYCNESERKKTLSTSSFFSSEDNLGIDVIQEIGDNRDDMSPNELADNFI